MADQAEFCPPSVAGNFTVTTGTYYGTTIGQYVYLDEQNQFQTLLAPGFADVIVQQESGEEFERLKAYYKMDPEALWGASKRPADLGWEGAGPQPADSGLVSTVNLADAIKAVERQVRRDQQGLSATHAISALHDQRRADGRPHTFLPEID
jgi:hypothetical protein